MLGFVLAAFIGLSLGILGGGGSILTVPIFVYIMGFEPKQAIAMSLPVVGATSIVGAVGHWRAGNFDLRVALMFGVLAMTGAFAGAHLASLITGIAQLALLAIVMFVAAALMLRGASTAQSPRAHAPQRDHGAISAARWKTVAVDHSWAGPLHQSPLDLGRAALIATTGIGVGILTGLVGIGGGFLFVPALHLLARIPMKTAVGTSLFIIAMNTAAGVAGYHGQVLIPWLTVVAFIAIAAVGIVAGTQVVRYVSQVALRRAFAVFLLLMAAFILVQNRTVLLHPDLAMRPSATGARR